MIPPVARTRWTPSAVTTSSVSLATKRAVPFISSAPLPLHNCCTPPVSFFTIPFFHAWSRVLSTLTPVTVIPITSACRAFSTKFDAAISALEGMHPQFKHTPPQFSFSITNVFCFNCPSRIAATYPPGPPPTTIAS
jgi:hypothetical protein